MMMQRMVAGKGPTRSMPKSRRKAVAPTRTRIVIATRISRRISQNDGKLVQVATLLGVAKCTAVWSGDDFATGSMDRCFIELSPSAWQVEC